MERVGNENLKRIKKRGEIKSGGYWEKMKTGEVKDRGISGREIMEYKQ